MYPSFNNFNIPYGNPYTSMSQPKVENNIQWVQGMSGAKAYPVNPNGKAIVLDSKRDGIFYIKTADDAGICKLRTFKFEEITDTPEVSEFVTRQEFQAFINEMRGLNEQIISRPNVNAQQPFIADSTGGQGYKQPE